MSFQSPDKLCREQLERWDREMVWHAFTQMAEYEPLLIERGEGCRLFDIDGNEYLDAVSSLWCNVHGHRHPHIDAAIVEQLGRVAHTTSLGASNSTTVRLARRLVELAPPGLNHVFFSDDGATAVEVALKMAFQYWRQRPDPRPAKTALSGPGRRLSRRYAGQRQRGRGGTVSRALCAAVVRRRPRRRSGHVSASAGRCGRRRLGRHYLGELEAALAGNHERLAAMVIEPLVQGAAGMVVHPPGYLRGVARV